MVLFGDLALPCDSIPYVGCTLLIGSVTLVTLDINTCVHTLLDALPAPYNGSNPVSNSLVVVVSNSLVCSHGVKQPGSHAWCQTAW